MAQGWGGDQYALIDLPGGGQGLAWAIVWDDGASRDRFVGALGARPAGFPGGATLEALDVSGHPGALLRVGLPDSVQIEVELAQR